MVHRQVAALVGDLRGHDHQLAPLHPTAHHVIQVSAVVFRQTAYAEALDDEAVVAVQHELRQCILRAGDQLQQPHIGIQPVIEQGPWPALTTDVL